MSGRVYLDWNATAPLRPEARAAMLAAMDAMGNPSSVHAEGRAAKGIVEKARGQVAALVGCEPSEIVFTSGATEAAALVLHDKDVVCGAIEHDCVVAHARAVLGCDGGMVEDGHDGWVAQQGANSETGICQAVRAGRLLTDQVQVAGKRPSSFRALACETAIYSAHKLGGPKGVGGLVIRDGFGQVQASPGGGQEMGRRSGTENVIGIAGFGAAAEVAARDVADGVWDGVGEMRDRLEEMIIDAVPDAIVIGREADRLPNTSCVAVPGWKGETQVMQMDLAGYAISAGSACSSGKVKDSRVLRAMGFDSVTSSSAIRVSLGPVTTRAGVEGFARVWIDHYRRWKSRGLKAAE